MLGTAELRPFEMVERIPAPTAISTPTPTRNPRFVPTDAELLPLTPASVRVTHKSGLTAALAARKHAPSVSYTENAVYTSKTQIQGRTRTSRDTSAALVVFRAAPNIHRSDSLSKIYMYVDVCTRRERRDKRRNASRNSMRVELEMG
jgi:hypothetical protein